MLCVQGCLCRECLGFCFGAVCEIVTLYFAVLQKKKKMQRKGYKISAPASVAYIQCKHTPTPPGAMSRILHRQRGSFCAHDGLILTCAGVCFACVYRCIWNLNAVPWVRANREFCVYVQSRRNRLVHRDNVEIRCPLGRKNFSGLMLIEEFRVNQLRWHFLSDNDDLTN